MKLTTDEIREFLELDGVMAFTSDVRMPRCYWVSNEPLNDLNFNVCSLKYLPLAGWHDEIENKLKKSFKYVNSGIFSNNGTNKGHLIFVE